METIGIEFTEKNGSLTRITISAKTKKEFKKKLNKELKNRNIDYCDYEKWNPAKFDREHKWFQ